MFFCAEMGEDVEIGWHDNHRDCCDLFCIQQWKCSIHADNIKPVCNRFFPDEFDGLMTCFKCKWTAIDVELKVFTSPHNGNLHALSLSRFTIDMGSSGIGCNIISETHSTWSCAFVFFVFSRVQVLPQPVRLSLRWFSNDKSVSFCVSFLKSCDETFS